MIEDNLVLLKFITIIIKHIQIEKVFIMSKVQGNKHTAIKAVTH